MKNFMLAFSVFMMWAVLGMWYYSCILKEVCQEDAISEQQITKDRNSISEDVTEEVSETSEINPELQSLITADSLSVINTKFQPIFSYPLAPEIQINSPVVEIPQTTSIFVADVSSYLEEHPDSHLFVFGAYDENEFNTTEISSKSHGQSRAAYIRDLLVEEGVQASRISIKPLQADLNFIQEEEFNGGILLQVKNYNEFEAEDESTNDSRFNLTINTNFDQTFRPDQNTRQYAVKLKEYLDKNPGKRVSITGHTDDIGDAEDNQWIGMERAKSVRDFLETQGIQAYKMQTFSKGETEPLVENNSRENRAKNRRIEIEIN